MILWDFSFLPPFLSLSDPSSSIPSWIRLPNPITRLTNSQLSLVGRISSLSNRDSMLSNSCDVTSSSETSSTLPPLRKPNMTTRSSWAKRGSRSRDESGAACVTTDLIFSMVFSCLAFWLVSSTISPDLWALCSKSACSNPPASSSAFIICSISMMFSSWSTRSRYSSTVA